jgi:hypothetical protein
VQGILDSSSLGYDRVESWREQVNELNVVIFLDITPYSPT